MEKIITLKEAARFLKVAPITLYRRARKGEIPAARVGKGWRFHREQLEEWLKEQAPALQKRGVPSDPFRHLSTREANAVLRFIGLLKPRFPSLRQVILYGSRARGDFEAYSDIDLLLTFKAQEEIFQKIKREIIEIVADLNSQENLTLQPLILPEEEWQHPSFRTFLLVEKIQREGIPLYG